MVIYSFGYYFSVSDKEDVITKQLLHQENSQNYSSNRARSSKSSYVCIIAFAHNLHTYILRVVLTFLTRFAVPTMSSTVTFFARKFVLFSSRIARASRTLKNATVILENNVLMKIKKKILSSVFKVIYLNNNISGISSNLRPINRLYKAQHDVFLNSYTAS